MGFGHGISGLNAAAKDLDVIGNNIANVKTVGYKAKTAVFADVYSGSRDGGRVTSRVGLGVNVTDVSTRFSSGLVTLTGNGLDMALMDDKGMFVVRRENGELLYTRNGQFFADKNGRIMNAQGQQLMGFSAPGSKTLVPMAIPLTGGGGGGAGGTGTVVLQPLDAGGNPAGAPQSFQYTMEGGKFTWAGTPPADGSYQTGGAAASNITVDANGNPQGALPTTGGNHPPTDGKHGVLVLAPTGGGAATTYYYEVDANGEYEWYSGENDDGSPPDQNNSPGQGQYESGEETPVDLTVGADPDGTDAQLLFANAGDEAILNSGDNIGPGGGGSGEPGTYAAVTVGMDGVITVSFSDFSTVDVGQVALADFVNMQGLRPMGGNAWAQTGASGPATLGAPGADGFAQIMAQAIEESNVDLPAELVNLIIAQRNYQANAQTIKTQDQVLQTVISLR